MTENNKIMAGLVDQAYMEVIPTKTIVDRLVHVPRHSYLSITCSPVHGIGPTLDLAEELRSKLPDRNLKLVPHIAARMVRDRSHLKEILQRLEDLEVDSVFVPGGDAADAAGDYDSSLDLLRDMAEHGHQLADIGIASHPEGHPLVDDAELLRLLKAKQPLATYLVTQMCFDAGVLIEWLRKIRHEGVTLPAWLGLPGVAEIPKLISLSLKIGVGQSLAVLKKQKGLVRKMLSAKPYQPDDLLAGLQPYLDDLELNIPGFHLFCFNNIESTERWRMETLKKLNGAEG
jgi:methylenetetrahydrofolate reductase (NADPH)